MGSEPGTSGFDVVEGGSAAGDGVTDDGADTADEPATVVQVDCDSEESRPGEPIRLAAVVLAHAAHIVENDDSGHAGGGGRHGQIGRHVAAQRGDENVGHLGFSDSTCHQRKQDSTQTNGYNMYAPRSACL